MVGTYGAPHALRGLKSGAACAPAGAPLVGLPMGVHRGQDKAREGGGGESVSFPP